MATETKEFTSFGDFLQFLAEKARTSMMEEANNSEPKSTEPEEPQFDNSVAKNKDGVYFIHKKVGRYIIDDGVTIPFSTKKEDGTWTPGVTNRQLVHVLIDRYSDDPRKVALLKQLL